MATFSVVTVRNVDTHADENVNMSASFDEMITKLNEEDCTAGNTANVTQISVHD